MNNNKDLQQLYDEVVNTSVTNLLTFMNRNKRENFFIPYREKNNRILSLYDIEIAKIAAIISDYNIITIEVHNLSDLIFLYKLKYKLRKNRCSIKKAKQKDINNDINIYTNFMKEKMNIDDNIFIDIYNDYFKI